MGNKVVAVFLMCIVVIAAMHIGEALAGGDSSKDTKSGDVYDKCYEKCKKDCQHDHRGYTFCEMKCDTDCSAKELEARLKKASSKKD